MYDAFRMPLYLPNSSGKKGQALDVWGDVRPAHWQPSSSKTPQIALIQFEPPGGGGFKTIARVTITDKYGYFNTSVTFPSSGSVRTAWSSPTGQIYSRVAPVTIH
jgi:hypothetical protein